MSATARCLLVLLLLGSPACRSEAKARADGGVDQTVQGVRFLELFPHGADQTSALIVAIHGRGGTPEKFATVWRNFPGKAELAFPQAPTEFAGGWSWFHWPPGLPDDELAATVGPVEEKLWRAIVEHAHGRKIIIAGYSQGGVLSFVLAARHPGQILYAFPISGGAPARLRPRDAAAAAPVFALHGTVDDVVPIDYARATIAGFKKAGATAELREYADVGHIISPKMREDLFARVLAALNQTPAN